MEMRCDMSPLPVRRNKKEREVSGDFFDGMPQWEHSFCGTLFGLSEEERTYQQFMAKENPLKLFIIITIVGTVVGLFNALGAALSNSSIEYKLYVCQRALALIPLWLHMYATAQMKISRYLKVLPLNVIYIGDAVIFSFTACYGIFMFGMTAAQGCDSSSVPTFLMCDNHVPVGTAASYIVLTLMLSVIVKCRHVAVVLLSLVIELTFLSIVVYKIEPTSTNVALLLVVALVQFAVAIDFDSYSRRTYMLLMKSHSHMRAKVLSENDKVVMEMQTKELRFLIGNVAHDLKTPLQAFSYELDIMKSAASSSSQGGIDSILLLESICSFMLMTINRAIDYTKVTSGIKLKPSMETVDVGRVFDWVQKCVARTVTTLAVSIIVEPFSKDMCNCIITDKQWLMENLLCLISNAQKFTARGEIRIKYTSPGAQLASSNMSSAEESTEGTSPMVMVEVIDDGIGISEEMQQTLFKPFKQAQRQAGGTGLGIYSLSKRVESLGGSCGVTSRLDGKPGARFWFTLPYRPDFSAASTLASLPSPRRATVPILSHSSTMLKSVSAEKNIGGGDAPLLQKSMGIMLVEDSPLIQKTCVRSFLREGIKVDVANNGLECVEKVSKPLHHYRILLMDVNMPLMDGLEATERIRQWERDSNCGGDIESGVQGKRLLIIGVSANSDSQSRQEALDAGMDRFISKPLKMDVFREILEEFNLLLEDFTMDGYSDS